MPEKEISDDYFVISKQLLSNMKEATIYEDILGSDHCPIGLEIKDVL